MPTTGLLLVLIGTALANRLLLRHGPLLGARRPLQDGFAVALASVFTLIAALGIAALLGRALQALELAWPSAIVLLLAVIPALLATRLLLRRSLPGIPSSPRLLALLAGNASAIGMALPGPGAPEDLLVTLLQGLAAGIGFGLLLLMFTVHDERLAATAVPAALRGTPLLLLGAAVLALAVLLGLRGH